jgi:hypothetical protein
MSKSQEKITRAAIRDVLLPKLLSGKIRVKDAEKFEYWSIGVRASVVS